MFRYKRFGFLFLIPTICAFNLKSEGLTFRNVAFSPIEVSVDKSTGLQALFVVYDTSDISVLFESSEPSKVEWYKFGMMGAAYAEKIGNITVEGQYSVLLNPDGNMGYQIIDGQNTYFYWLTDYSSNQFHITSVSESYEKDCDRSLLDFDGNASPIYYYNINGRQETLDREIELEYYNLEWDESVSDFIRINEKKSVPYISSEINITPPFLCQTSVIITGDRFLKEWNKEVEYQTGLIQPSGIDVMTTAIEEESIQDESNQIKNEGSGLGGSAPAHIMFNAYCTEGVVHYEWQMADDSNFDNINHRFYELNLDYTFEHEGSYYVRFIGSNSDGSCEQYGETYNVNIGSSELLIPNAFSPDGDGVNDIWKVSYRSLIDFKCWIYDRHGHQVYYFDNPADGWDGKHNGKIVGSGVYFYVINATGSDGRKYKKSGDINIIKSKVFGTN